MEGFSFARKVFSRASRTVPAYRTLLHRAGVRESQIRHPRDFSQVPIIDKHSYISKNSIFDLVPEHFTPPLICASSGSSGKPTFWVLSELQEQAGTRFHEHALYEVLRFDKRKPTLIIDSFSMGVWVAGQFTYSSTRGLNKLGYPVTSVTPGLDFGDNLNVFNSIAPQFQQILLCGYPPFVMDILKELQKQKIKIPRHTKLLTAGDKVSEEWRESALDIVSSSDLFHDHVNLYGCADAGALAFETPLTIFLRRKSIEHSGLRDLLWGDYKDLPAIFQYKPDWVYFESFNGELVFTADSAIPLIRYNLHDLGRIIHVEELHKRLELEGLFSEAEKHGLLDWKFPLLVKGGRTDVAVTFYALNIYPEHIRFGLESKKIKKYITGTFFAYTKSLNRGKEETLHIEVELKDKVRPSKTITNYIAQNLFDGLLRTNIEFRKLYNSIGNKVKPRLSLKPYGIPQSKPATKALLSKTGKKPKVILPQ